MRLIALILILFVFVTSILMRPTAIDFDTSPEQYGQMQSICNVLMLLSAVALCIWVIYLEAPNTTTHYHVPTREEEIFHELKEGRYGMKEEEQFQQYCTTTTEYPDNNIT